VRRRQADRVAVTRQRHRPAVFGRHRLERRRQTLPVEKVERARRVGDARARRFPDANDAIGRVEGQGLEQHRVEQAEHGRVRADAEREDADDDRGEERLAAQPGHAVARVARQGVEPPRAARVAMLFLDPLDAAEAAAGGRVGLVGGEAGRARIALGELEVRADLGVELVVHAPGGEQRDQPPEQPARGHDLASKKRAIIAVVLRHRRSSACS
jgi:hypothetical protein